MKEGVVPVEDVKDYITGSLKEEKVNEAYSLKIEEWMLDYNFTIYTDVLGISPNVGAGGLTAMAE